LEKSPGGAEDICLHQDCQVLNDFLKIELATLFSPYWHFSMKIPPNDRSGKTLFLKMLK
jgi:hypothetical protein